jgi:amidohydrolase
MDIDRGRVRFIFQPNEEVLPGGALEMVREGLADDLESLIAFHMDPTIPAQAIGLLAGPITGSSDRFKILVEGPGGHTARPHDTVDTIAVAARIVTDVPELLHQRVDARLPVVMVFGRISGGQAENVIPALVELSGTCRTTDLELWAELPGLVESLIRHVGDALGAKVTVRYEHGVPSVINDEGVIDTLRRAYGDAFGLDQIRETYTSMGAEDFSRYLDRTPGALIRLGAGLADQPSDLNSASFDMDERSIETGIAAAAIGLRALLER